MAYTREEESAEFWMLTKGMLQDSSIDTDEARVIKRWVDEHGKAERFPQAYARLEKFLVDGYIDRFESKELVSSIGSILRALRTGE